MATSKAVANKPLTCAQVMKQLKSKGTAQNRKIYARHGAPAEMYGVSYADLGKLKKQIKTDHDLALELWDSGIMDARTLATMVCDPEQLTKSDCDRWARESKSHMIANAVSGAVRDSPHALSRYEKWRTSKNEFVLTTAWATLGSVVKNRTDEVDAKTLREAIKHIEANIHTAPNRAREAMNTCLICIGTYRDDLRKAAIAAAKRIGKVEIDHGETGCKTPDAVSYIEKSVAHRTKKRAK